MTIEASCSPAAPRLSTLSACFKPRTIAVIGPGRSPGVGASILRNLLASHRGRVITANIRQDRRRGPVLK